MRLPLRPALLAAAVAVVALVAGAAPAGAAMSVHGSVAGAYVVGAKRGDRVALLRDGRTVRTGRADRFGSKVFIDLRPGAGYRAVQRRGARVVATRRLRVLRGADHPAASFYRGQHLKEGLNYIRMRDGVELAMTVRLPAGKTLADGPFPTLIEYSGYQVAAPHDLLKSVVASLTGAPGAPTRSPRPPAPRSARSSRRCSGFAVVSVQMRGSGCSGGAFDLFGLATTYDGYDAVETVAAQPWVKGGKVGLAGISFSGITQLFVAGTRPPHLAAIAPMSVTDDLYTAHRLPGRHPQLGLRRRRGSPSASATPGPRPIGGQPYAKILVRQGDAHCKANQRLRLQTRNLTRLEHEQPLPRPRRCSTSARAGPGCKRITVPTFLVGQFQDEQTGGHFAESLGALNGNPNVWISLQNGVHADSLGPTTITRWAEFLKLYVADEIPVIPSTVLSLSGALYSYLADAGAAPVQQSRFAGTTDVAAARATFERDPRVRLAHGQRRRPAGPRVDRRHVGDRRQRLARRGGCAPTTCCLGARGALRRRAPRRPRAPPTSPIPPRARARRCPAAARPTRGRPSRPTTGRRSPRARASASRPRRSPRTSSSPGPRASTSPEVLGP